MRQVPDVTLPVRPRSIDILDFARFKAEERKISIVTAYDAWSARLVARSNVDAILVGDSAAMVMHGHQTTLAATVEPMAMHTRAVAPSPPAHVGLDDIPLLTLRNALTAARAAVCHRFTPPRPDAHPESPAA